MNQSIRVRQLAFSALANWFNALVVVLLALVVVPLASAADSAVFTSQAIPTKTMVMGKTYAVSIVMRNNGTTTWVAAGANAYSLVAQNPAENQIWGIGRIALAADVKPGASATFAGTVTAPTTPGTYNFQWQMRTAAGAWFGAVTAETAILVGQGAPSATVTYPATPLTISSSGAPVTLRVAGVSTPSVGGIVGGLYLLDNGKQIAMSKSATSFDQTVTLSAGAEHRLQFRAVQGLAEGLSAEMPVLVTADGTITDCASQLPLSRDFTATTSSGPVYGNNTTGYNVGSDLSRALAHSGLMTPGDRATVTVTPLGQLPNFGATTANGITSSNFGPGCGMLLKVAALAPRPTAAIYTPAADRGFVIAENATHALVKVTGEASATAASAIKKIELYDGSKLLAAVDGEDFDKSFELQLGRHQLKLVATNKLGQFGESQTVAVTVTPRVMGDGAQFVAQTVPRKLRPGEPFDATVTMVNTGNTNWDPFSHRLGAVNPENSALWVPSGRASLSENLGTSYTSVIQIPMRAPAQVGTYNFQWRMVREPGNWFGEATPNQVVLVEDGPGPTATLVVSPTVTQVVDWGTTAITFKGNASSTGGNIRQVELWSDNGKRVERVAQASTELNFTRQFGVGIYRFWLRATDASGVKADSDPVTVSITNSPMLGESKGVRTGVIGNAELYGWACMPGVRASLNYQVLLDSPFVGSGTLLTTGVANVSTEWDNESVQYRCGFTQTPHHFVVPLERYLDQYSGRRLYVLATSPDGKETLELSCPDGFCLVPGVTRVVMTTPLTGARVTAHADTFLRMVVSNVDVPIDDIGFMVDGDWVPAKPDGAPGAYSANKAFWPTAQNHTVYGRVRQGTRTIKSMEQWVTVVEGPLPKAKLAVTPTNTRVSGNGIATLTFVGSGSGPIPLTSKVEVFQDSGTGYPSTPIKTLTGNAATLDLNFTTALTAGVYKFKLRATNASGVQADSAQVVVNITNSPLLGMTTGVRIDAAGNPKLVGWMCQSGSAAPLAYQLLLDAPTPLSGGIVLTSGTANVAAEPDDAAVQTQCLTPGASHHFAIDLGSYGGHLAGRQLYVYGQTANGASAVSLPCADNNCTMPGSLRVGITTPTNGQVFTLPNPAFLRMKVSDLEGAPVTVDEIGFFVDGTWIAADAELDAPGAYSVSTPLAASATPYTVQAKVRQGNITLFSVQNQFTMSGGAAGAVTMTAPFGATTVATGTVVALKASVNGTPASVRFFANGTQIGVATSGGGSWNHNWTAGAAGAYSVVARGYDAGGVQLGESAPVVVTVSPAGSATPLPIPITPPHLANLDAGTLPGGLGVSPAGAATYSIPIVVPPGTAGMEPNLAISYNSSGANGILGLGWNLEGLSSIHRCGKTIAQDGVNERISFENTDRLCLDGKRLVLVNLAQSDVNYWADNAEYRTEIDEFSRVTAQGTGANRSFKVELKNGRVLSYGSTPDSFVDAIVTRANSGIWTSSTLPVKTGAQSWALARIVDRSGNYISISYQQDATTGEHHASFIRYGGAGLPSHAAVAFSFVARNDAWKRYIDETRNDLRQRLDRIKTYVGSNLDGDVAGAGTLVRDYALTYEYSPSSGRSLLNQVKVSARNPNSGSLESLPTTSFAWGKPDPAKAPGFVSRGFWPGAPILTTVKNGTAGPVSADHSEYFAYSDFEHHGYTDVLEKRVASPVKTPLTDPNPNPPGTKRTSYRYFHNNGAGFTQYAYKLDTGEPFVVLDVGDFDGDGALDLLVATDEKAKICLSPLGRANALGAAGAMITFTCDPTRPARGGNSLDTQPYVVDILGDGRSAHYSSTDLQGAAKLCIQRNACVTDSTPPNVLSGRMLDDGSADFSLRSYYSSAQMVDFGGTGKPYDVRWSNPHAVEYVYLDNMQVYSPHWENLEPTVSLNYFRLPGDSSISGAMLPYVYTALASPPLNSVRSPYKFDFPSQGAGLSGDFNGSGYTGLAFGYVELGYINAVGSIYNKAELTLCLSTGRALDCGVRKKYSGRQYGAVQAVGNFVGDGQASILLETLSYDANNHAVPTGAFQMCKVTSDDTTGDVNDAGISCAAWPGITRKGKFMDLLGTGRMQWVQYYPGAVDAGNVWREDGRWEVLEPIDLAVSGQALDRIHSVTNGLGAVESLQYVDGLVSGTVTATNGVALSYPQHAVSNPGKIVKRISRTNGVSPARSTVYTYQDEAVDVGGRGSLGYASVTATDEQTGIATVSTYGQVWPYTGMTLSSRVTRAGIELSSTVNSPLVKNIAQANGASTTFVYTGASEVCRRDLDGSAMGCSLASSEYDNWGNQTAQNVSYSLNGVASGFSSGGSSTFKSCPASWLPALPSLVKASKTDPVSGTLTRTVEYDFDCATGLILTETVEPALPAMRVLTTYGRANAFGLVNTKVQNWAQPGSGVAMSRTVSDISYDANGRYPLSVKNAAGHVENYTYEPGTGARKTMADINALTSAWESDGFGRVTRELRPDGNETRSYVKQCAGDCPAGAVVAAVKDSLHGAARIAVPQVTYSDSAGHTLRTQSWGFDGRALYVDQRYDNLGLLQASDQPRFDGAPAFLAGSRLYDVLGRVTSATTQDEAGVNRSVTTTYRGLRIDLTNEKSQTRSETRNFVGQVTAVLDANGKSTTFAYEPFGNLTKTTDPSGNVIQVGYDLLGRKTDLRDPDLGWIHYDVDALGRTYQQISAVQRAEGVRLGKTVSTTMTYDSLDRMTARLETDLESHWVYDGAAYGKGKLQEAYTGTAANKDYIRTHTYDDKGRPLGTSQRLQLNAYKADVVYDDWGRVIQQTYQRGTDAAKKFDSRYNNMGQLARLERGGQILWQVTAQDAAARPTAVALGNGLAQSWSYNGYTGRVEGGSLATPAALEHLKLGYTYDVLGNMWTRDQAWDGVGFRESYTYDNLNRLASSQVQGQALQSFTYNDTGGIVGKTGVGTGNYVYPAQGAGAVRPHAVQSIPGVAGTFLYDDNGNLTAGNGHGASWTSFDMPKRLDTGTLWASFVYGPEHQRTRQDRSDGSSVVYAGAQEVETKAGKVTVKTYWPYGVGVEMDITAGAVTTTELNWLHVDRLGSVVAITGASGELRERLAYDAWGKRRQLNGAPTPDGADGQIDNRGYTGHEMLDQLDLVHMNGRVYDPVTAKFLSGDPIIQDPMNGQGYNRYSYVLNNPTNLTDPTGFQPQCYSGPGLFSTCAPSFLSQLRGLVQGTNEKNFNAAVAVNSAPLKADAKKPNVVAVPVLANTNRDDIVRDAMLSSPNPAVAQAAACVGNEGTCVAGLVAGLGGGWLGSAKVGQVILGLFGFGSQVQNMADGVPSTVIPQVIVSGSKAEAVALREVANRTQMGDQARAELAEALANTSKVIHPGAQGKHIIGHNNYIPGKSVLTANPNNLLNGVHNGDYSLVGKSARGQPVFNFNEEIGYDLSSGMPTNYGTVHSSKVGAHIVPANPAVYGN